MAGNEHLCDRINFMEAAEIQNEIYTNLRQAYDKAKQISGQFSKTDLWQGRNKQALLDYMSLVMQMHGEMVKTGRGTEKNLSGVENVTQETAYGLRQAAADVGAVGSDSDVTGKLGERL